MCSGRKMLPCFFVPIPELGDLEMCVTIVCFSSSTCSQKICFVDVPVSGSLSPCFLLHFIDPLPHPRSGSFHSHLLFSILGCLLPYAKQEILSCICMRKSILESTV